MANKTAIKEGKEEALSHEALREEPKFYRNAHLGRSMDEVEGQHAFRLESTDDIDPDDEEQVYSALTQAGVDEPFEEEDLEDDVKASGKIAPDRENSLSLNEADSVAYDAEVDVDEEDNDEELEDYESLEDDSDLDQLPKQSALQADRNL